jgi:hypothetical protein
VSEGPFCGPFSAALNSYRRICSGGVYSGNVLLVSLYIVWCSNAANK